MLWEKIETPRSVGLRHRQAMSIDGFLFEVLNIGFAWPTPEAAMADARDYIERMNSRLRTSKPSTRHF